MRFILIIILSLALQQLKAQDYLNVMSFNIRLDVKSDSLNAWPYRRDKVASQILFHETHVLGVQEALYHQMQDLQKSLDHYRYIGTGRDDGALKGEFSAIFFDTLRLHLIKSGDFWLSETPEIPGSKSWDAAITRMVSWGYFRDRQTGDSFYVFNTHFDHIGKQARHESAKLIRKRVNQIAGERPVIITGDFNSKPGEPPVQELITGEDAFIDSKSISVEPHYGPEGTFTGFRNMEIDDEPIDYIFVRNTGKVLMHASLSQTWKGRFSSDHFPVFARIEIE